MGITSIAGFVFRDKKSSSVFCNCLNLCVLYVTCYGKWGIFMEIIVLHLKIAESGQNRFWIQCESMFCLSFRIGVKLICNSWQLCEDNGFVNQVYYTEGMCN